MLNWAALVIGLVLIGLFWNKICQPARKKETKIVTIIFLVLGIIVYFAQTVIMKV